MEATTPKIWAHTHRLFKLSCSGFFPRPLFTRHLPVKRIIQSSQSSLTTGGRSQSRPGLNWQTFKCWTAWKTAVRYKKDEHRHIDSHLMDTRRDHWSSFFFFQVHKTSFISDLKGSSANWRCRIIDDFMMNKLFLTLFLLLKVLPILERKLEILSWWWR